MENASSCFRRNFLTRINNKWALTHCFWLILTAIAAGEMNKVSVQAICELFPLYKAWLVGTWLFGAVLGSSGIGIMSDRFIGGSYRKSAVLFGILLTLVTLRLLCMPIPIYLLYLTIFLNGFGSFIGAGRAFFLDNLSKNKLAAFTISVLVQCLVWGIGGAFLERQVVSELRFSNVSVLALTTSFLLCLFLVKDVRKSDSESRHFLEEIRSILRKFRTPPNLAISLSFCILVFAYQLLPYRGELTSDKIANFALMSRLGWFVGGGAILGYLCKKFSTTWGLLIGYLVCAAFFGGICFSGFNLYPNAVNFYALLGGGTLWVFTMKDFLNESKLTEDGLILGCVESLQSIAELGSESVISLFSLPIFLIGFTGLQLCAAAIIGYSKILSILRRRR